MKDDESKPQDVLSLSLAQSTDLARVVACGGSNQQEEMLGFFYGPEKEPDHRQWVKISR